MAPPLPLARHLRTVLQRCRAHERCVLLLDYDGTLTPIVPHPDAACLSPTIAELVSMLANHPRYRVAIVSGRALNDLRRRVAVNGLFLGGNHGLEIEGPEGRYEYPEAQRMRPHIQALVEGLRRDLAEIPGAFIEDKGVTLSVHHRGVPETWVQTVKDRLDERIRPAVEAGLLRLSTGKAVLEVRPHVPWDKGEAVRWMVDRLGRDISATSVLAIYLGDDETDEDAFRALASTGIAIVVGSDRQRSAAHYWVESVEEVERFLRVLHERT